MDNLEAASSLPWLNHTIWNTMPATTSGPTNNSESLHYNWTNVPDCPVLQFQGFIPWDNEDNLISLEVQVLFEQLAVTWFLPILFFIGGPANLINMVVFYKQGLKERNNTCLFALALADELYLSLSVLVNVERIFAGHFHGNMYGSISRFMLNNNLLGFSGFAWVSQFISAIIASERCFCILSPLRSQTVLKTRTMALFIAAVFIVVSGMNFLVATKYRLICIFDPFTNSTGSIVGSSDFYYENRDFIHILDSVVYGAMIPGISVTIVYVTTVITAVKLRHAVARRAQMSSSKISPREVALTRMLIGNSIFFIVCVLPVAVFRFALLFLPEIHPGRRRHNTFFTAVWIVDVLAYTNSSFNIFIYYTMGSRYRATLKQLCGRKKSSPEVTHCPTVSIAEAKEHEQNQ